MTKKKESDIALLRDLKPGEIIAVAKCDAIVIDVNSTMKDDGTRPEEVVTVTYVPCHLWDEDTKKKDHRELTAYGTDGVALTIERLPQPTRRNIRNLFGVLA
jgi:hypothetical protein